MLIKIRCSRKVIHVVMVSFGETLQIIINGLEKLHGTASKIYFFVSPASRILNT